MCQLTDMICTLIIATATNFAHAAASDLFRNLVDARAAYQPSYSPKKPVLKA